MKITLSSVVALLATASLGYSVSITNFGSSNSSFTTAGSPNTMGTVQNALDMNVSGNEGEIFAGIFDSVDIASTFTAGVILSGSTTDVPGSSFTLTLFEAGFANTAVYSGGSWTSLTGGSTTLSFVSSDVGFDASDVVAFQINTSGTNSTIDFTAVNLSTVPEPSTYAALAGLCALGYVMVRRRK
jgi:hypothetical protein